MALQQLANRQLMGETADSDIMSLLQQQYGGQQPVSAPSAPTVSPVSQAAQVSADPQSVATFASRFQNELAQMGWAGGDPIVYETQTGFGESGQETRQTPVGVSPEFQQFMQGKNLQVALDPSQGAYRVTLLAGGQPIGQYQESKGGFERFMDKFQPLAVNAVLAATTGGALNAALAAAGVPAATAATVSRALAPTVVQAAATGNVNIDSAARNVVASLIAPEIGNRVASAVTADKLIGRTIANAVGSAVATTLQQGADLKDVLRNVAAGGLTPVIERALPADLIDRQTATSIARAVGTYVASGDATNAIVSGLSRYLTEEQKNQALLEQRKEAARQREIGQTYQDPSRQLDVLPAGETGQVTVTGQAEPTGITAADIQQAIKDQQVTSPAAAPIPQVPVTATRPEIQTEEPFAAVVQPAPSTAPPPTELAAPVQQIPVTGVQPPGPAAPVTDADVYTQLQREAAPPALTAPPQQIEIAGSRLTDIPSFTKPEDVLSEMIPMEPQTLLQPPADQRIEVTGERLPPDQRIDVTGRRVGDEDVQNIIRAGEPATITTVGQREPQRIDVTGQRISDEDIQNVIRAGETGRIEVTGQRPPQQIEITGQRISDEDLQDFIRTGEPAPSITVTGQRPPQQIEVTGQRISDEDLYAGVSPGDATTGVTPTPAPAPSPVAAPAPAPGVAPSIGATDIFSFIRRGRPAPMSVAQLASMGYPMGRTVGTGGFTPAGELEPGGSTKPRQPVWNEASLRLKDALGL